MHLAGVLAILSIERNFILQKRCAICAIKGGTMMQRLQLLHGGDYNPEQWLDRPDVLAQDIALMKRPASIR